MGLVLSRRIGESVFVGKTKVTVTRVTNGKVKLTFAGPKDINIVREELLGYKEISKLEDESEGNTERQHEQ